MHIIFVLVDGPKGIRTPWEPVCQDSDSISGELTGGQTRFVSSTLLSTANILMVVPPCTAMGSESREDTPIQTSGLIESRQSQSPFASLLVMTVPLASFFFGVAFVFFGVVINAEMSGYETGLGVILVLGVFFLIIAFVSRQVVKNLPLPNASTCLALFVLFEFIAGTGMFLSLIVNVAVDSQEVGVAFYVLSVFGLLLVADSLLFYQRNFKKNPHS
jgi:hypothetical protein